MARTCGIRGPVRHGARTIKHISRQGSPAYRTRFWHWMHSIYAMKT